MVRVHSLYSKAVCHGSFSAGENRSRSQCGSSGVQTTCKFPRFALLNTNSEINLLHSGDRAGPADNESERRA